MGRIALLFLALLSASVWLWGKTRLPNVEPISGEELKAALSENAPADTSLGAALEKAAQALAAQRPQSTETVADPNARKSDAGESDVSHEASPEAPVLSLPDSELSGLPRSIIEALATRPQIASNVAQAIAQEAAIIESLSTSEATLNRVRILASGLRLYQSADEQSRADLASGLIQASLRVLETPSPASPSTLELQALRQAVALLKEVYSGDPSRLAAVKSQILPLHLSPESQDVIREMGGESE